MTIEATGASDPAGENTVDELADLMNAGDFDSVGELLHEDVSSDFFGELGRAAIVDHLGDLALRNVGLTFTRGELEGESVLVAWTPSNGNYQRMGYFSFNFAEVDGEALIEHFDYHDLAGDGEALVADQPDPDEIPEGTTWQEWDSGES